jgi:zinc/manganese transport system ATP-binding protein
VGAPVNAIGLHNLTLGYERRPAVHHLEGAFDAGRLHAVVGPNGSGKSTLLKGIAGALRPLEGRIDLAGLKPRDIAYLPQESGLNRTFPMTLEALVSLGLWNQRGLFGAITRDDRGQLQRALFARVLVQDARLILLDEPFASLDARTQADLIDLVLRWPGEGRTVVMVLHDLDLVRQMCPDTLLLAREAVAWGETVRALDPENLLKARRLSEAWAEDAHPCHKDEGNKDHGHKDHAA